MHPLVKVIIGVILGFILSMCVVVLAESIMTSLYPLKNMNPSGLERIEAVKDAPINSYLIFMIGLSLSSLMGSYLAARISADKFKLLTGITIGFALLLFGIFYFIVYPYPYWVSITTILLFLPFSYLGSKMAIR
jgi:uncharacterized membrane protein YfcA